MTNYHKLCIIYGKEWIIMLSILVCDDDKSVTDKVTKLIKDFQSNNNIELEIDVKNDSTDIDLKNKTYDIAIIDIEMPNKTGLALAREIKHSNEDAIIIILSSHMCYLDSAMDIQVFRYLTKPIDVNRFTNNFQQALKHYKTLFKEIIIEDNGRIFKIKTFDILYIENIKHGSNIITKTTTYKTNKKPAEWMEIIDQPNCFTQSHKSYIVNLQNVIAFDKKSITFSKGKESVSVSCISQRKYKEFKAAFFNFACNLP